MFEQSKQRDRREPAQRGVSRKPRKNSGRRLRKLVAAGILGRDIPTRQRRQDATAKLAVRRNQGRRLALVHRFAQRHRDRERLVLGVGGFDHAHGLKRRVGLGSEFRLGRVLPPSLRGRGRSQDFRHETLAAVRYGEALDRVARDTDAREQGLHGELRMSGRSRNAFRFVAGDQPPGFFVEICIETR